MHGFPVRLVIAGWPGSVSAKWLTRIWVRDKVHDGQGMGGTSYRVADEADRAGRQRRRQEPSGSSNRCRCARSSPVRRTAPSSAPARSELKLRGAAWAGDHAVKEVDVSIDFGASWQRAKLDKPKNKYDWQRWTATVKVPSDGYYEIWSRGNRRARPDAAARRRQLEPARLRRQPDAPHRGAGGVIERLRCACIRCFVPGAAIREAMRRRTGTFTNALLPSLRAEGEAIQN